MYDLTIIYLHIGIGLFDFRKCDAFIGLCNCNRPVHNSNCACAKNGVASKTKAPVHWFYLYAQPNMALFLLFSIKSVNLP